jgi:hypothetical protein
LTTAQTGGIFELVSYASGGNSAGEPERVPATNRVGGGGMPRAGVLVVILAGLIFPGAGAAHFQSGGYSHRDADCASRVDPITVVFYEWGWPDRVRNHLNRHGGWDGGDGGGQFFASHGNCESAQGHSESGCAVCTRYHIRLRKTEHAADDVGVTTTGTPHHEDWVKTCNGGFGGHAVDKGGVERGEGLQSGFDQGRSRIYSILVGEPDHAYGGSAYWGNTQEFKQCDGDWAGSHGTVYWFEMPSYDH